MPPVCLDRPSRRCGKNDMKAFFCTLALSLCAALLLGGILWADMRTRAVTFEDSVPPYAIRTGGAIDLPFPAAGEALRYLYHSEKTVLKFLLEKAENIT